MGIYCDAIMTVNRYAGFNSTMINISLILKQENAMKPTKKRAFGGKALFENIVNSCSGF
jgi:hypothetical protein